MRRLIARLFHLEVPRAARAPLEIPPAPPEIPPARIMRLEERVDFLEGAVNRLRGQVTGGLAHRPKAEDPPEQRQEAPGATIDPQPIPAVHFDRSMALASHRRAKNAVLPG
jgi:hypothetical protein